MYEQQSLLTADLDEIIDATGHNDAQPQEQAQKAPAVKYYPIDEETARRAHEMMSMRDYPAGRATNEYRASVDKAAALVERCKAATSPYYHGKLDALLDRYARRLAQWTNDYNRNGASCPSILVSGGSNFPVKKKQRQNAREDSLWQEYKEIEAILHKIKTVGSGPVDLADPHAREMLTDQLQQLQNRLDTGKAMNAYYRKHKTLKGFPGMSDETAAQKLPSKAPIPGRKSPCLTMSFPACGARSSGWKPALPSWTAEPPSRHSPPKTPNLTAARSSATWRPTGSKSSLTKSPTRRPAPHSNPTASAGLPGTAHGSGS